MGLARLLTVGGTFGAATNPARRYRRQPGVGLPKLGPVTGPAKLETAMKQTINAAPTQAGREEPPMPAPPESALAPAAGCASGAAGRAGPAVSWWQQAGRFLFEGWGRKQTRATRVAPPETGRPVQQELALGNVKPCCNDLRDADWEMIPPPAGGAKHSFFRKLAGRAEPSPFARVEPSSPVASERL